MGAVCVSRENPENERPKVPPEQRLYVLTSFFMPLFSKVRIDLYKQFEKHMSQFPEVELWTIECALLGNPFYVTQQEKPRHAQVNCA